MSREFCIHLTNGERVESDVEMIYDLIRDMNIANKCHGGFIKINNTLINIKHIIQISFRPKEDCEPIKEIARKYSEENQNEHQ